MATGPADAAAPTAASAQRRPPRTAARPDDRQGAARAAARHRPVAVRRAGLRRHLGRGDRRAAPASPSRSSTSTSAARRASTPSSSTARCSALLDGSPRRSTGRAPARAARAGRARAARLRRGVTPTGSASWSATRRSAQSTGVVRQPDQRHRVSQVEHILVAEFKERGFDPKLRADVRPDAGRHGRAHRPVVARRRASPTKAEVAAHLVNLAWNGLSGLEAKPELRDTIRGPLAGSAEPAARAGTHCPGERRRRSGGTGSTVPARRSRVGRPQPVRRTPRRTPPAAPVVQRRQHRSQPRAPDPLEHRVRTRQHLQVGRLPHVDRAAQLGQPSQVRRRLLDRRLREVEAAEPVAPPRRRPQRRRARCASAPRSCRAPGRRTSRRARRTPTSRPSRSGGPAPTAASRC